ncbi:MAG: methyltransferase domain-containing protein [Proteobacteria bacterium]|nr:methyltransferase domain-containing protein [Pseudomonadota bacterium]
MLRNSGHQTMKYNIMHHFSRLVLDYDKVAKKVVINNDELHNEIINSLNFNEDQELKILDIGGITGQAMQLTLKAFPNSRLTGIFFSSNMLERAKINLRKYLNRCEFILNDITNKIRIEDEAYDAIVSSVTIHNITDSQKTELFKKIFNSLKPAGQFINGDFYLGENDLVANHLQNLYLTYVQEHLTGDDADFWIRHIQEDDMPMKLSEQFEILRKIGFINIKLKWVHANEAVYSCVRPVF